MVVRPDPVDIAVGARIRARRLALGLGQKQLSVALGVACQRMRKYEDGEEGVPAAALVRIAARLNTTAAALLGEYAKAATRRVAAPKESQAQASLRESEARLEMAVAAAGLGVWEWRRATGKLTLSARAREICGFSAKGPVTTRMTAAIIHRNDRAKVNRQIHSALDPNRQRDDSAVEYRIVTPAGERRRIALNGRGVFETVDGVTKPTRFIGALRDITADHAGQVAQERSATRLRLALGAARVAVWQSNQVSDQVHGPEFNEILGFPSDHALTAEDVRSRYLPGELERIRGLTYAGFASGQRQVEVECRFRRLDGKVRWLLMRGELALNSEGQPRALVGVAMDITDRKDAEERLKLLAREVDHRANNLLSVVQSIVQLSNAATPPALRRVLLGRITALGRAHQLLSAARWQGADLRRLVVEELLAFSLGESARVLICGEDVALSPPAAQGLAMALHELTTNASKYGALSAPTGQVNVSWTRDRLGALTIRWVESGGPPVTAPTRKGLGATILARALAGALNGETSMDWRPEGLVCEIRLPGEVIDNAYSPPAQL
jgi:PAS domain S-box-containing protein